jgi:hypothetical protein
MSRSSTRRKGAQQKISSAAHDSKSPARTRVKRDFGNRSPTYESRMKAAGFRNDDGDAPPENIHAFRNAMARRIHMFINAWRGCPEGLCRRHRGCMAPNHRCTNAPPVKATAEESARAVAQVYRQISAAFEGDAKGGAT